MNLSTQSGDSITVVQPVHPAGGGSNPTSPLQFQIVEIPLKTALQLNETWHSRMPKCPPFAKVSYGAIFDNVYYACAMWSNPIARLLPQYTWLELRRLAISNDAPKNTASRMIKVMTHLVRKKYPEVVKLISYQDEDVHEGTIYKASGWYIGKRAKTHKGWYRVKYPYPDMNKSYSPKTRWEKDLT
jgi:hypothetical protein